VILPLVASVSTKTPSHLLYLPSRDVWIRATRTKRGWRFFNGRDAALWILEPGDA
jgi:hypothetical protein